jgi:lysophospholipase L1-like esterase
MLVRHLCTIIVLCLTCGTAVGQRKINRSMHTYLALGDSYTIGEQVAAADNFPHQTVRLLNSAGTAVSEPLIIATTGWTTDELAANIMERNINETFSIVSLLIGVNNQYRGRDIANYQKEFTQLLHTAIGFAGGKANRVFVLSIPDWGVTPFAADRDRTQIAKEIDAYNAAKKEIALHQGCHYIEITESTRAHGTIAGWLAEDGLHPSGKEYAVWAERLAAAVSAELDKR